MRSLRSDFIIVQADEKDKIDRDKKYASQIREILIEKRSGFLYDRDIK